MELWAHAEWPPIPAHSVSRAEAQGTETHLSMLPKWLQKLRF